jgi:hypothetical protein
VGARRGPTSGGGLRNAESQKTQIGHKDPQKQPKKERKAGEKKKKKTKESGEGEPGQG